MCGRSLKGFSPSWAISQAVDLLAQEELHQRPQWENPGKNTATGTRRRKFVELPNTWMPEDDLKLLVINRLTQLQYKVQDTFDPTGFSINKGSCSCEYETVKLPFYKQKRCSVCHGDKIILVRCIPFPVSPPDLFHTRCHHIVQKWTRHLGDMNGTKKSFKFVRKR